MFDGDRVYYIICSACSAQIGPGASSVNLAQAWNKRAPERTEESQEAKGKDDANN